MRFEVRNAKYLARSIYTTIENICNSEKLPNWNIYIAFEGLSYGSFGDVVLQLGGYKYILMDVLSSIVPLENMFTFAPITIKKTAGCSKKGMKKSDMIESFKRMSTNFGKYVCENEEFFRTKKGNWIKHLDDIVDSFWTLETLRVKLKNN